MESRAEWAKTAQLWPEPYKKVSERKNNTTSINTFWRYLAWTWKRTSPLKKSFYLLNYYFYSIPVQTTFYEQIYP